MNFNKIYNSVTKLFKKKNSLKKELRNQKAQLIDLAKKLKARQRKSSNKKEIEEIKQKRKIVKKMIDKIKKSLNNG